MAANIPQHFKRRKLIYGGVIALLSLVMVVQRRHVEDQASKYDLQEIDLGDVDLGGSMARYALVSFRGPLICGLWWEAVERQSKHDWAGMRMLIQTITKLQPHFKQPWIYQSWNLAYNVSVEFDRIQDKYFFIAEGSQLLVDGEKQNRAKVFDADTQTKREVPDLEICWHAGFYQQQKVSVSDEAAYYRILLQLSCIKPDKWNPDELRQNPAALAGFKTNYPRLMQRLRELRRIPPGDENRFDQELLAFLEAFRQIPSLYATGSAPQRQAGSRGDLSLTATRFPLWAERKEPANPESEDVQDAYEVSRSWYERGNESLPPPPNRAAEPEPLPKGERRYRLPQRMFTLLYRCWPAKARAIQAGNLDKEGFFDPARKIWDNAWQRWKQFGMENGVDIDSAYMRAQSKKSMLYRTRFPALAQQGEPPPEARVKEEPELAASYQAFMELIWHQRHRGTANYDHWEPASNVHRTAEAGRAHKHLHNARHLYRADFGPAREEYEKGFELWKNFLVEVRPDFLLALGPTSDWGGCFATQPTELFKRTAFGINQQGQEDLGEAHGRYLRIRARDQAPHSVHLLAFRDRLDPMFFSVESPMGPLTGLRGLALNVLPRSIDFVEMFLAMQPGPLDAYLLPAIVEKYGLKPPEPKFQEIPGVGPGPKPLKPAKPSEKTSAGRSP